MTMMMTVITVIAMMMMVVMIMELKMIETYVDVVDKRCQFLYRVRGSLMFLYVMEFKWRADMFFLVTKLIETEAFWFGDFSLIAILRL